MTDDRTASFLEDLARIAGDPQIRALARRCAGNPHLAEDALQDTYCAVAQVEHPERIDNLPRYFRRALASTAFRLRAQAPGTVGDAEDIAELSQHGNLLLLPPAEAVSADFESRVHGLLRAEELLSLFMKERHRLAASVPARSGDPRRYRASIAAAALQILQMITEGTVTSADWTAVIRSHYPEWYDDQDPPRTIQRLHRAREDTRTLLKMLVRLDDAARRRPASRSARSPRASLYLAGPPGEHLRDSGDAVITALFVKAEQTLLPQEVPYDLDRGLQVFTAWLGAVRQ